MSKPLPRNEEAERAVLASALTDAECLPLIASVLDVDDFFLPASRAVYKAMLRLQDDAQPIDAVTVKDQLEQMGLLEEAGGFSGIGALLDSIPDMSNVERHAQIVKSDSQARRLVVECRRIATAAYDRSENLDSLVMEASNLFAGASRAMDRVSTARDSVLSVSRWIESDDNSRSTKIGIPAIDGITGGYEAGVLHIAGARPGVGKTALMLSAALNVAVAGGRVLMFEMDMSRDMIDKRLVAAFSGVPLWRIRNKQFLVPEDIQVIAQRSPAMAGLADRIMVDYHSRHVRNITAQIRRYAKSGLDLVVVDHIGHVRGGDGKDRYVQLGDVSSRLIEVARQVDVPVLALSQLNRGALTDSRAPKVSDLRESGNLEQDARTIFLLDRPSERNPEIPRCRLDVVVGKNEGPSGDVIPLHFNLESQRIDEDGICGRCSSNVVANYGVLESAKQVPMLAV